jgi:hypothetical protein
MIKRTDTVVTEAAMIEKAKARGYILVKQYPDLCSSDGGYYLHKHFCFDDRHPDYSFEDRSQATLYKINEILDDISTIAEQECFDAAAGKTAPGSETVQ